MEDTYSDIFAIFTGAGLFVILAISLFMIIVRWKIYTKAGKPGWAVIVPIYSTLVFLEIVNKPWWWILLLFFVPIANIVCAIIIVHRLSLSFGKDVGFTLGLIFLGIIFYPILAFGSATYTKLPD